MKFQERLSSLFILPQDGTDPWRKKAWDRFLALGWPDRKREAFQYIPLSKFTQKDPFQSDGSKSQEEAPPILPECGDSFLLFIDGHFCPERSKIPSGVVASSMQNAMKLYALVLQNRIARMLKEETDPLAALNGAFQGNGLFLYIPPQVVLKKPIQIAHISTNSTLASPRIQLFMGQRSQLELIQTGGKGSCNALIDCALDEGAKLSLYDIERPDPSSWQFHSIRATLKRESCFESFHYTTGSETVRTSFKVELSEENSEAVLRGISALNGSCQSHIHGVVEHKAPHCRSHQKFKSVLDGKSQFSFEGKIKVDPIAQKTESYQSAKSLLLSDEAVAYAKPNLEIFADDVKASHGATVAQPDEEELFYLRSRGLSLEESKKMLVEGFYQELIDEIPFPSLRSVLSCEI